MVTLRRSRSLSASGAGCRSFNASCLKTNLSISLYGVHVLGTSAGIADLEGETNDQCGFHSAPCSTHFTSVAISREVRLRLDPGGGMRNAESALRMRLRATLWPA